MGEARTYIHRSVRETTRALVTGFVTLGLVAYLLSEQYANAFALFGSLFFLLPLGIYSFWQALAKSYVADCPGCGAEVRELKPRANQGVLCGKCRQFLDGDDGTLRVTPPEQVAEEPIFGAPLMKSARWPDECCLCGEPPTHVVHLSRTAVVRGERARYEVHIAAPVPHCDACRDGATIDFHLSAHVWFRSHRYLRAYCAANDTRPTAREK